MGINKILNAGKQHLKVKALGLPKGSIEMYEEWEKSGCNVGFGVYCFQAGENSKHKSDLQQELEFLKDLWVKGYGTAYDSPRVFLEARINLIEKELKVIK